MRIVAVTFAVWLNLTVLWAQSPTEVLLNQGQSAFDSGDLVTAGERFTQARERARTESNNKFEARALVGLLETLDARAQKDSEAASSSAIIKAAIELERSDALTANLSEGQAASNLLGIIFLRLNMPDRAVEKLLQIELTAVKDPERRLVYTYNRGRAYERNGNAAKAFEGYLDAVRQEPSFRLAMEGALRVLESPNSMGASRSVELCGAILAAKNSELANNCLRQSLVRWAGADDSEELLELLVSHYVDVRLTADQFENIERPRLAAISARGAFWMDAISEIVEAFHGEFARRFPLLKSAETFPTWAGSKQRSKVFSRLLFMLGYSYELQTGYRRLNDSRARVSKIAAYYAAAWSLDHYNTAAESRFAMLLEDQPELDPQHDWLNTLVREPASSNLPIGADVHELSRFHQTLGNIFAKSRPCVSQSDPFNPFYQYIRAAEIETGSRDSEVHSKSPELNRRLADCYRNIGDTAKFERFDNAVEESLKLVRPLSPFDDKLHYHLRSMVYAGGLVKSAMQAGFQQAFGTPEAWGSGSKGFGRRLASSHSTRIIRQGLAFTLDTTFREDPHFMRAPKPGYGSRFLYASKQTFIGRSDRLVPRFAIWRVGSAFLSELISNTWRPDDTGWASRGIGPAMARGSFVLLGDTVSNILREFLPQRGKMGRLLRPFTNN